MSEFSSSFHFYKKTQDEVANLLKKNKVKAFVYKEFNNWVTAVVNNEDVKLIKDTNSGFLIEYNFAEDHGWEYRLFNGKEQVSVYQCMWDNEISIIDSDLNESLLKSEFQFDDTVIQKIFYPTSFDDIYDFPPAYLFADTMGIKYYSWLSFDSFDGEESDEYGDDEFVALK